MRRARPNRKGSAPVILAYGNFRHAQDECEVVRTITRDLNVAGQTLTVRRRWDVRGQLQAADSVAVTRAKVLLEAAYSRQFLPAVLYLNDGRTVHDALTNRGSTTGVRVVAGPDFPVGRGAEGSTFLTYSLALEVAFEFSAPANADGSGGGGQDATDPNRLESWTETISVTGGGPRYAIVEVVSGAPVRQLLNEQTKVRVVQRGQAKGFRQYLAPPGPLFPAAENAAERVVEQSSPERPSAVGQPTGYPVSWTYVMEGAVLGAPDPNPWPFGG